MKYIMINVFFALLVCSNTKGQNVLYDTIRVETVINAKKDSITSIIKMIDCKKREQVGFINKYSSSLEFNLSFNYSGLNYIYLLEVAFLADTFSNSNTVNPQAINTSFKSKYQYYPFCVLVKKNNLSWTRLNYKDLVEIKKYLNQWWNQRKYLPFNEIRDTWILEKPLNKLGYYWK